MNPSARWRCLECWQIHAEADLLRAPNPWRDGAEILGCPSCRAPVEFVPICDEFGCDADSSCGWPSPSGYRQTCERHNQEEKR